MSNQEEGLFVLGLYTLYYLLSYILFYGYTNTSPPPAKFVVYIHQGKLVHKLFSNRILVGRVQDNILMVKGKKIN